MANETYVKKLRQQGDYILHVGGQDPKDAIGIPLEARTKTASIVRKQGDDDDHANITVEDPDGAFLEFLAQKGKNKHTVHVFTVKIGYKNQRESEYGTFAGIPRVKRVNYEEFPTVKLKIYGLLNYMRQEKTALAESGKDKTTTQLLKDNGGDLEALIKKMAKEGYSLDVLLPSSGAIDHIGEEKLKYTHFTNKGGASSDYKRLEKWVGQLNKWEADRINDKYDKATEPVSSVTKSNTYKDILASMGIFKDGYEPEGFYLVSPVEKAIIDSITGIESKDAPIYLDLKEFSGEQPEVVNNTLSPDYSFDSSGLAESLTYSKLRRETGLSDEKLAEKIGEVAKKEYTGQPLVQDGSTNILTQIKNKIRKEAGWPDDVKINLEEKTYKVGDPYGDTGDPYIYRKGTDGAITEDMTSHDLRVRKALNDQVEKLPKEGKEFPLLQVDCPSCDDPKLMVMTMPGQALTISDDGFKDYDTGHGDIDGQTKVANINDVTGFWQGKMGGEDEGDDFNFITSHIGEVPESSIVNASSGYSSSLRTKALLYELTGKSRYKPSKTSISKKKTSIINMKKKMENMQHTWIFRQYKGDLFVGKRKDWQKITMRSKIPLYQYNHGNWALFKGKVRAVNTGQEQSDVASAVQLDSDTGEADQKFNARVLREVSPGDVEGVEVKLLKKVADLEKERQADEKRLRITDVKPGKNQYPLDIAELKLMLAEDVKVENVRVIGSPFLRAENYIALDFNFMTDPLTPLTSTKVYRIKEAEHKIESSGFITTTFKANAYSAEGTGSLITQFWGPAPKDSDESGGGSVIQNVFGWIPGVGGN